jgi:hypothetical protein
MSLADLIRGTSKRNSANVATPTLATPATDTEDARPNVATVATVTVADSPKRESAGAVTTFWWLHFPGLDPVVVAFAPPVDRLGALAAYPRAVTAELY